MNKRRIKKALSRISNLPRGKYFFLYFANKARHYYLKSIKSTQVAYPSTIMLEFSINVILPVQFARVNMIMARPWIRAK